jgi:beta-lactamase regulating signal transducer with metallopeptidase domain
METGNELIRSLGMAMIHSLWQGAIISILVMLLLEIAGKSNARMRYYILFGALLLLVATFGSTFTILYHNYRNLAGWNDGSSMIFLLQKNFEPSPAVNLTLTGITGWLSGFIFPACRYLAFGWLVGFMFMSLKLAGGMFFSRINLRQGLQLPGSEIERIFSRLLRIAGLPATINLRITAKKVSPMVMGFLKPVVILPAAALSGLNPAQIEAVIAHELAHLRRYDHVFIIIQALAGQVMFFHPASWFLMKEIDRERENCCDDFVVRTNHNPINYIKALTMIQEMSLEGAVRSATLTGKSNQLLNRVKRLLKPEHKHSPAFRFTLFFLFLTTFGVSAMTIVMAGKQALLHEPSQKATPTVAHEMISPPEVLPEITMMNTMAPDDNPTGGKKKMKVVFAGDTIKEMTVNGRHVSKEDMKEYENEINKLQEEVQSSQKEANQDFQKVLEDMARAQKEMQEAVTTPQIQEFPGFPGPSGPGITQQPFVNPEQIMKMMQSEAFREQMKKAQEESRKAMEEMKEKQQDFYQYWQSHQEEFREQMKKAQEEMKKALEEMKKNNDGLMPPPFLFPGFPAFPSLPNIEPPADQELVPLHEKLLTPEEINPDDQQSPEKQSSGELDLKLRELEEDE